MKWQLDANTVLGLPLISGHRFIVTFFVGGRVPNPLDIRFQKVSGLGVSYPVESKAEGGKNETTCKQLKAVEYKNLVLERGMVVGSALNILNNQFNQVPSNVLVALLASNGIPIGAWQFYRALPVSWSTSDLDAQEPGLLIDTMELAYSHMRILRV